MSGERTRMQHAALDLAGLGPSAASSVQREALTALFRSEFRRVYGYVFARTGSTQVAEEIAADAFAEAARVVRAGRGDTVTATWLIMVARRRLIDHWRRAERHRRRIERLRLQRTPAESTAEVEDEQMLAALASLPLRQRAALTLRYIDEYSVGEIAETLDVPYKAAESLLSRARAGFTKAMEADHA